MLLRFHGFGGAEVIVIFFVTIIVAMAIYIPYLLTLQRALEAVSPDLRRMSPGMVWLMLIPFFSVIWIFMVVTAIADSFDQEYRRRGIMSEPPRPTYNVGLAYAIMALASVPGNLIPDPAVKLFFGLFGLAGFVLWIVYWVQVAGHKNKLNSMPGSFGGGQQYYGQQQYYQQPNQNQQQQYYQQPNYNQQQPPYGQQYQQPPQQQQQPPQNPDDPNRWGPPNSTDQNNYWGPPKG